MVRSPGQHIGEIMQDEDFDDVDKHDKNSIMKEDESQPTKKRKYEEAFGDESRSDSELKADRDGSKRLKMQIEIEK